MHLRTIAPLFLSFAVASWGANSSPAGVWRGQSACGPDAPSTCHNETVVYYIEDVPDHPDVVTIKADRIVDGKPVTMGSGPWKYDRSANTLEWTMPERTWFAKIQSATHIEGSLTLTNKQVVRKMTLDKDH